MIVEVCREGADAIICCCGDVDAGLDVTGPQLVRASVLIGPLSQAQDFRGGNCGGHFIVFLAELIWADRMKVDAKGR